ncbi:ATP-dependent RecD-like DNA helicase [Candidatus Poribacteria bacterium]|nr:ATP-dependent RecD-like DNA helicase [Candidatus Poribacteria bacterium]
METLKGTLERIVYENPETGYTIARFISREYPNELLTVIGNLMSANPGETVLLQGEWVNNPQYGRQFKIEKYETVMPATVVGIKKYLGSGLIKGIGPVMASRIVSHFGMNTLDIIEKSPRKLDQVPGIGPKRVSMIMKAWQEQREIKNIMLFLQSHNVSTSHAVKIYKTYENEAINVVRENPYQLADDIYGIGFKTADTIAQNLGVEKDSPNRIMAGIQYVLNQQADEGHVYLPEEKLVEESCRMLEANEAQARAGIVGLLAKEAIVSDDKGHESSDAIYLAPFYYAEVGVANGIARLIQTQVSGQIPYNIERNIGEIERIMGIRLAENQKEAIKKALNYKVMILTGGPGTGKTTTILGIIWLFEKLGRKITLACPTGRAAKRLSEVTGREAKTIHRLLEYSPMGNAFKRNQENPLATDVVIIDEVSMVDLILMNNLVKAIPKTATLIFVGDIDQLPSVGAGNILRDLIDSECVEVVRLTEIFRQAQQSMIITNAHKINKGIFPQLTGPPKRDFFFIEAEDPEKAAALIQDLICRRLPKHYDYHPINDIQLICPMRRGTVGVENFNRLLQDTLNKNSENLPRGGRNFRIGDKVMQIRNNYDYEVFNGDIGRITNVNLEDQKITITYPEKAVDYDVADLNELVLAYAITVHKAQGSEYKAVVMPLLTQHYMMLQRNLVYTGITRAKELVVMVGTKKALGMAIRNNQVVKRYTGLVQRLQQAMDKSKPEARFSSIVG